MRAKLHTILIVTILTLYGAVIIPSEYYTQDMVIHVPVLKAIKDPELYQRDYTKLYSRVPQEKLSLYYPLLSLITTISPFSFQQTFRVLYFVYLFSYLLIIWKWSEKFTDKIFRNGLIMSLVVLIHFQVGGAAISVVEAELLPRAIGVVTSLWGAYYFVRKRYLTCFFIYLLSFLVHPLEVFYVLFITGVFLSVKLINTKRIKLNILLFISTFILISGYIFAKRLIISPEWLEIIKLRSPYVFMSLWSVRAWLNLFIALLPGFIYITLTRKQPQSLTKLICLIYGSAVIFTLGALIFTHYIPIQQVIIMQAGRIWLFPALISVVTIPVLFSRFIKNKYALIICVTVLVLFGLFFNYRRELRPNNQLLESWLTLQKWVKNNTSKNCLFLVPFYSRGFRMESERAIVGEEKDGGHSLYSFAMTQMWRERKQDLTNWEGLDAKQLENLREKYKFDYIVTSSKNIYPYSLVYENSLYKIYSVTKSGDCSNNL